MQREREKRQWSDKSRTQSYHGDAFVKPDVARRQSAAAKQYLASLEAHFRKPSEKIEPVQQDVTPTETPSIVQDNPKPRLVTAEPEKNLKVINQDNLPATNTTDLSSRQLLLSRIANAQGSRAISDAIEAFFAAGFTLPDDQEVHLQMLEHRDETRVREAISQLDRLLVGQLPKRKPVLVQRLKRLEENADELATQSAARLLRHRVA